MSCGCNSNRRNGQNPSSYSNQPSFVPYQYVGALSLTVTGGVTRNVYRFAKPGDIVPIDRRDLAGMAGVPNVRQVSDYDLY